jgi:hypothetical protein
MRLSSDNSEIIEMNDTYEIFGAACGDKKVAAPESAHSYFVESHETQVLSPG